MNFTRTLIAAVAIAMASGAALAQATITQDKALAGNVTPGDLPGFPVTLSKTGSYKLMGNLVVPAGHNGIEMAADNVTLDLNGFSITGATTCTRNALRYVVTCDHGFGGYGILDKGVQTETVVRNGTVRGFGIGVYIMNGRVEDLLATQNSDEGIWLIGSRAPRAVRVRATLNGLDGISLGSGHVIDSESSMNGGSGIGGYSTESVVVQSSVVLYNRLCGLHFVSAEATLAENNKGGNRCNVVAQP